MCPSLSPNDNGFAIGIDNATLEEFFQGSPQLVSIAKVVVQDPFLHINPVPSPDLYDFHGNHPPLIVDFGFVLRTPTLRAGSQFRIADQKE